MSEQETMGAMKVNPAAQKAKPRTPKVGDRCYYWMGWGLELKPHVCDLVEMSQTVTGAWNCVLLMPIGHVTPKRGAKFAGIPTENCLTFELPPGNVGQSIPNPLIDSEREKFQAELKRIDTDIADLKAMPMGENPKAAMAELKRLEDRKRSAEKSLQELKLPDTVVKTQAVA